MNHHMDFGSFMEPVAKELLGEPNKRLSSKREIRFGNGGSMAIDPEKGRWFDHENGEGGGVLDLIMHCESVDRDGALEWMEMHGFLSRAEKREERQESAQEPPPPPEDETPPDAAPERREKVQGYVYVNADGDPLYEVVRYQFRRPDGSWVLDKSGNPKKTFLQRRRDASGEVVWNLDGIGHTIYRHNKVEIAIAEGKTIYLPEGEKDADTLVDKGFEASTNSGGAKNWTDKLAGYFRDADVVILVDNDETGIAAGEAKAKSLKGIARRIRVLNLADHVPNFPAKHDVTDWYEAGGTVEQFQALVDGLPDWRPKPPKSKFGAERIRDFADQKIEYDWLVKGLIERGGVFMVAGEMQSGKSFFVIDLGMKIARGEDYCGRKVKQGLVIHQAGEDGRGVKMRAAGYKRDKGIEQSDIPFMVMKGKLHLMNDDNVSDFIEECRAWAESEEQKLELIIIDTLSVATEGLDEINSKDVGQVLGRVNRIAEQTGAAVCLVHHMNAEGRRVRGHTSLTANVSQVIEIRQMAKPSRRRDIPPEVIKDSNGRPIRKAVLAKNKNGPNRIGWKWVLRQVKLGLDDDGAEISTCVLETPSSDPGEPSEASDALSEDRKLILNALRDAQEDAGEEKPDGIRAGPQIKRVVGRRAFVGAVKKVWPFRAPPEDVEGQTKELTDALKRHVTWLINHGYMGRDNDKDVMWLIRSAPERVSVPDTPPEPKINPDLQKELGNDDGVPF